MRSFSGCALPALGALLMTMLAVEPAAGWETYEFQLFDLMEEVKENFYDFIGVTKDASTSDIKKAYRKLSLKWHPDKRKTPDAEVLFRQLVAVNEVLTDDIKRRRYDELLVVGLPDWRQPVFYYRRVRKLGVAELAGLMIVVVSIIHYAMMWAAYWEKIYEVEERWLSRLKRSHKKKSAAVTDEITDIKMSIHRPSWRDTLLFRLFAFAFATTRKMPLLYARCLVCVKGILQPAPRPPDTVADEAAQTSSINNQSRACGKPNVKCEPALANVQPVVYNSAVPAAAGVTDVDTGDEMLMQGDNGKVRPWTETEVNTLVKAMVKYPVGSFERWDKIALSVGRPVSCVTAKVKELKLHKFHVATAENAGALVRGLKNQPRKLDPEETISETGATLLDIVERRESGSSLRSVCDSGTTAADLPAEQISSRQAIGLPNLTTHTLVDSGNSSGTDSLAAAVASVWSQQQQKQLENALATVPRGLPDRWDRVAELVPGKSKADCILRCKDLADKVRQRRQQTISPS